jgi:hypothetical protein
MINRLASGPGSLERSVTLWPMRARVRNDGLSRTADRQLAVKVVQRRSLYIDGAWLAPTRQQLGGGSSGVEAGLDHLERLPADRASGRSELDPDAARQVSQQGRSAAASDDAPSVDDGQRGVEVVDWDAEFQRDLADMVALIEWLASSDRKQP